MKKGLLFVLLLVSFVGFGQCPSGDVIFSSQFEIDDFETNYPGCNVIQGNVIIDGPGIINLIGLSQIFGIDGSLSIMNTNITSLNGLHNVSYIAGDNFSIAGNSQLINVNDLGSLDFLNASSMDIINNVQLQSLMGFNNIPLRTNASLRIIGNTTLNNLSGFGINNGLYILEIQDNDSLTSLEGLENLSEITSWLYIMDNDLLSSFFGLNSVENLGRLEVINNPLLLNISSLNTVQNTDLDITIKDNINLSFCSEPFLCKTLLEVGNSTIFENNQKGCNLLKEVKFFCGQESFNTIEGTIYNDYDSNGCMQGDNIIQKSVVEATSSHGQNFGTVANDDGYYKLLVPKGDFTVSIKEESIPFGFTVSPESFTVSFTDTDNLETINFCVVPEISINDLNIVAFPIGIARPGFSAIYKIVYENTGTNVMEGQVTWQFDESKQTFTSATPSETETSTNLITWDFTSLLPLESRSITVIMQNFEPPIVENGDVLTFSAQIFPLLNDNNPSDNKYDIKQIVRNSLDPNDKIVMQGDEIFESETGEYLDYVVRFQNVGTASAVNVLVEDIFEENLNWDTFKPISSSDEYRLEVMNGNDLSFIFEDINLPPASSDPEGSNGYVAFQIKPISNIALGDVIENTADIYFDFNASIVTDTVSTTVVENLGVTEFILNEMVHLYPNPVSSTLQIKTSNSILFERASIYSILGKRILETSEKQINLENFSAGIYFVEVITDKGSVTKKIIKE